MKSESYFNKVSPLRLIHEHFLLRAFVNVFYNMCCISMCLFKAVRKGCQHPKVVANGSSSRSWHSRFVWHKKTGMLNSCGQSSEAKPLGVLFKGRFHHFSIKCKTKQKDDLQPYILTETFNALYLWVLWAPDIYSVHKHSCDCRKWPVSVASGEHFFLRESTADRYLFWFRFLTVEEGCSRRRLFDEASVQRQKGMALTAASALKWHSSSPSEIQRYH